MIYDVPLAKDNNDPLKLLLQQIESNSIVLEFGCASGRMTSLMKQMGCSVYIVEIDADGFQEALAYAQDGICCDIMSLEWIEKFKEIKFDYIIFADVLEHLPQPEIILKNISCLLKENGKICISIPNICHNDVVFNMIQNKFFYTPMGLLDNTHIHFWGYENIKMFLEECGFSFVWGDVVLKQSFDTEQAKFADTNDLQYTRMLSKRSLGQVYEFVFIAQNEEYVKQNKIEQKSLIFEHSNLVIRNVFFDMGDGFTGEEREVIYDNNKYGEFSYEIALPENIKRIRFDPVEYDGCIIENFEAIVNNDSIKINIEGGSSINKYIFFTRYDPFIWIDVSNVNGESITFSGKFLELNAESIEKISYLSHTEEEKKLVLQVAEFIENNKDCKEEDIYHKQLQIYLNEKEEEKQKVLIQLNKAKEEIEEKTNNLQKIYEKLEHSQEKEKSSQEEILHLKEHENLLQEEVFHLKEHENLLWGEVLHLKEHEKSLWEDILHLKYERSRLQEIENSSFWKITKPARVALDIIKKLLSKETYKKRLILWITKPKVKTQLKKIDAFLKKCMGKTYNSIFGKFKSRLKQSSMKFQTEYSDECCCADKRDLWAGEKPLFEDEAPLVSVIVPNYNHSEYLIERLDSIYNQNYKNFEVILLDDCSTDNSREILMEYAQKYKEKTKVAFNDTNAGFVFKQWNKGIGLAKGKYIWIAESDDYCSENFLSELVPMFSYQSVMLAFARSVFMQEGNEIWTTEEYLSDLPEFQWDNPFMMSAHMAVNKGFAIKNIIPNVSSMMFRNIGQVPKEVADIWQNIRLCGDWIFYLSIMKGGTISYTNKATNFYRVHPGSTSLKIQETSGYYKEQQQVSEFIVQNYKVDMECFHTVLNILKEHYKAVQKAENADVVMEYYNIDEIEKKAAERKLNVIMCCFSLQMGGGETYPLYLANEMKRQGIAVTVFDFNMSDYDIRVRNVLEYGVPLVAIDDLRFLGSLMKQTGADIVHSHHASVDNAVSEWLKSFTNDIGQVISLHGMYETMGKTDLEYVFNNISKTCSQFIYTADKNLSTFKESKLFDLDTFKKLDNGLPTLPINFIDREKLNIPKEAFVLCLVSRALAEKGWKEAVEAVQIANLQSSRGIHLILIGEGEMYNKYKGLKDEHIHVLGGKANVRDYFAISNYGFLPSRYPGESYPLVVIDSVMTGKPVLAADIGEIRNQLTLKTGEIAGEIFKLKDMKIDIEELGSIIQKISEEDAVLYSNKVKAAIECSQKFRIDKVAQNYISFYKQVKNSGE